ncbi:MAG TPA: IDEAL domain-containing protein, partial [Thermodesulfobacteriota bacterium]|nr:IDEAL domain-containing protein [Thermodesulfobacteriota bacterium]
ELNDDQPYVVITRLGAGLTENDFEVNVTECEEREEEFDLEPDSRYERLLKHKESYLILYYPIDIDEENEDDNDAECISEEELQRKVSAELDKGKTAEPEEESPESLQKKIDKALEDRDTEQFNALTERLNSLSNKKESGST